MDRWIGGCCVQWGLVGDNNETCFYQIHTPGVSAVGEGEVNWLC